MDGAGGQDEYGSDAAAVLVEDEFVDAGCDRVLVSRVVGTEEETRVAFALVDVRCGLRVGAPSQEDDLLEDGTAWLILDERGLFVQRGGIAGRRSV